MYIRLNSRRLERAAVKRVQPRNEHKNPNIPLQKRNAVLIKVHTQYAETDWN